MHSTLVMKVRPIFLFVLLIALLAFILPYYFRDSAGNVPEPEGGIERVTSFKPQITTVSPAITIAQVEPSHPVEVPILVKIPQKPVETLDQRGDAMLFEIDALQGTPFDEAIVRPFD